MNTREKRRGARRVERLSKFLRPQPVGHRRKVLTILSPIASPNNRNRTRSPIGLSQPPTLTCLQLSQQADQVVFKRLIVAGWY